MVNRLSRHDLLAGGIFIAFGVAFAVTSATYDIGSLLKMGPGYFPMVLGIILAGFGAAIILTSVIQALRSRSTPAAAAEGGIPWVRGALVLAAIMLFGFMVAPLGLVPALLVATFLAALAGHGTSPVGAVVIAVGLTALCVLIFVVVLQLRLPLFATGG